MSVSRQGEPWEPALPQPTTARIWRFMSVPKFQWLLDNEALYLCRADLFDDPLEGRLPEANRSDPYFLLPIFKIDPASPKSEVWFHHKRKIYERFRRYVFVNCWHLADEDSAHMWQAYCPAGYGIAVVSSYARLREAVGVGAPQVHIGLVDYADPASVPVKQQSLLHALFRKAPMYATEQELRVVITALPKVWGDEPASVFVPLNVNLPTLIDHVVICPSAAPALPETVRTLLASAGLVTPVRESTLPGAA